MQKEGQQQHQPTALEKKERIYQHNAIPECGFLYAYYLHKEAKFHCIVVFTLCWFYCRCCIAIFYCYNKRCNVFLVTKRNYHSYVSSISVLNPLHTLNCDGFCLFINENCFLNTSGIINKYQTPKRINVLNT